MIYLILAKRNPQIRAKDTRRAEKLGMKFGLQINTTQILAQTFQCASCVSSPLNYTERRSLAICSIWMRLFPLTSPKKSITRLTKNKCKQTNVSEKRNGILNKKTGEMQAAFLFKQVKWFNTVIISKKEIELQWSMHAPSTLSATVHVICTYLIN